MRGRSTLVNDDGGRRSSRLSEGSDSEPRSTGRWVGHTYRTFSITQHQTETVRRRLLFGLESWPETGLLVAHRHTSGCIPVPRGGVPY
jgi:hypothetical protein